MAVDGVSSTTSTTTSKTSTTDANKTSLDYNSFLKLLIAQMKNQDPTDPMDASEQLSQIATFSQVEQAIKTNSHLEDLISQTSLNSAASYIGKVVTSLDGSVSGTIASVKVTSDGLVATTTSGKKITIGEGVTIRDPSTAATEASALLGQTISSSDGETTGKVTAISLTSDGATATIEDGTTLPISAEMEISNTQSTTGVVGSYFLGKTLTSADGETTGVVDSVTLTSEGVFATTTNNKVINIVKGVTVSDSTS